MFPSTFLQWGLCSLNVVLMSKLRCAPRIFILQKHHLRVFRRICWKHGILLKIKSVTDAFNLQNFFRTKILKNSNGQILLIVALMVAVWLMAYFTMNCFCGMVDRRKAFSLITSRDHCQRSSPSRISDTPRAELEPSQKLETLLNEAMQ